MKYETGPQRECHVGKHGQSALARMVGVGQKEMGLGRGSIIKNMIIIVIAPADWGAVDQAVLDSQRMRKDQGTHGYLKQT